MNKEIRQTGSGLLLYTQFPGRVSYVPVLVGNYIIYQPAGESVSEFGIHQYSMTKFLNSFNSFYP